MSNTRFSDEASEGALAEIVRKTIEAYQRAPALRMLAQLCLPLVLAETGILATYAWYQHRRLQVFADEFTTLGLGLSEDDLKKREFFDAYTSTAQHVLSESRDEKIKWFARLFAGFVSGGCTTPIDRYEEHLLTLDMLSEREFSLLLLLHRHEVNCQIEAEENPVQRVARYWKAFQADAERELGINEQILPAILGRVSRTGMYLEMTGSFYGYGGGQGFLTPEFQEFLDAIGISAESTPLAQSSP